MSRDWRLHDGASTPGLRVALRVTRASTTHDDAVAIRVDVAPPARPMRISLYLDGHLMETWAPATGSGEVRLGDIRGRHVITARAVDGTGRWGGASVLLDGGPDTGPT